MSVIAFVSAAAAAAGEAQEDAGAAGLPQLDPTWWPSQLFWLALTFGVLYWLMASRFLPAIAGGIEERRDRIADDLDQADGFKRQAQDAEAAYNRALADAKAKAQGIAADRRAEVNEEIAEMQAETDATLDKQFRRAEERVGEMQAKATAKVREAANETARAIVAALIDEAPTKEAADRALDAVAGAP